VNKLKVLCGSSVDILSGDICKLLSLKYKEEIKPIKTILDKFSDGEIRVELKENLRGCDVYVIQSLSRPINDHIMELLLMLDTLKRCDVNSVTVVLPYLAYSRQDKKVKSRVPISARIIADVIQLGNVNRIVTVDLHSSQIQGFYNIPVDNLYGSMILMEYIDKSDDLMIISPDAGGMERAKHWATKLNCEMASCYKHRSNPNEIGEMRVIGDVKGKKCVIVDDMIDTGGTLCKAAEVLTTHGAKNVEIFATHGVLSGKAIHKINDSHISKVTITDTIPASGVVLGSSKFNIVSVDELLSEAIYRIHTKQSISELF